MSSPLDKLHDFYQPPPPSWVPQTVGWYVLFSVLGLVVLWVIIHSIRRWNANSYRREALRELATASPEQFSSLLKRTALSAWPREKVASLSGENWLRFLTETAPDSAFVHAPSNRIEEVALRTTTLSSEDQEALRVATAAWIRRHRVQA
jgi:hypothetical protein